MIPTQNIIAWGKFAPWGDQRQIEQDLIISRALVEIFSDKKLCQELRFRGGTALNKLHFPAPFRYSEDIDLVRTSAGPIGTLLDQLRTVLEPWLGRARFRPSPVAPKLVFRVAAEDGSDGPIRLKIEINTREREAFDTPIKIPLKVTNPWFSSEADIPTFTREEMLATKLRALLQRDKPRDLFDLAHALEVFETLNVEQIITMFGCYLDLSNHDISCAEAEKRMFGKLAKSNMLLEMRPLLPAAQAIALTKESATEAFHRVFVTLVERLPGESWAITPEMKKKFGIAWDS